MNYYNKKLSVTWHKSELMLFPDIICCAYIVDPVLPVGTREQENIDIQADETAKQTECFPTNI